MLEELGATFEYEEEVDFADKKGRDVRFSVGTNRGRMRLLRQGRRAMTLLMVPTTAFPNPEIRAFFEAVTSVNSSRTPDTAEADGGR